MYRIQKRRRRVMDIIAALGMVVLSFVMIGGIAAVRDRVWGVYEQPVEDLPAIASTVPVSIENSPGEQIVALSYCYNEAGTLVAYQVETKEMGYNPEVPIVIASTITADNRALIGIEVLSQKESEYYGARIAKKEFTDRFSGRYLPVHLTGTAGRGAHVDGIAGATASSKAVVAAIEDARTFVEQYLMKD